MAPYPYRGALVVLLLTACSGNPSSSGASDALTALAGDALHRTDAAVISIAAAPAARRDAARSSAIERRGVADHVVSAEQARMFGCAGALDPDTREHVLSILERRAERYPDNPGFDRFATVGASASRTMYFLTGFGRGRYTLAPNWEFLRPTIEHFAASPRRNSFLRKDASESSTGPGNWSHTLKRCPECPARLRRELAQLRPAFAVLMFGTNNAKWAVPRGGRRWFSTPISSGADDPRCAGGRCLPAWEPGDMRRPEGMSTVLFRRVVSKMKNKRRHFRRVLDRLLRRLLDADIVPLLTTIPPLPRLWPEEDTVWALNEEVRALARKHNIPIIDFWCALSPRTASGALDWSHPVLQNRKGLRRDYCHPQVKHAFDVADEHLIYGQNARNVLTLLRLAELRALVEQEQLDADTAEAVGDVKG